MNNRLKRLKQLIDTQFEGSQAEFARKAGIKTESQVTQWFSGYRNLGEKAARKIEAVLDLPNNWLDQTDFADGDNFVQINSRGSVPLISWVQAGHWQQAIDNLSPGEGERITADVKHSDNSYALRVKGDSMEPVFPEGCIIVVDPQRDATHGDYVIIRQNGDEATFKQLIFDGSTKYLKPVNPRYPIMALLPDAELCGVIIQMGRAFK